LYDKIKDEPIHEIDLNKSTTGFKKMATDLEIDPYLLREYHHGFHGFEKDHVQCAKHTGDISITEAGIRACLDGFWKREGERELNERIYDTTKWIIPVLALIVTLFSVFYSVYRVSVMSDQIKRVEKELQELKKIEKPIARYSPSLHVICWNGV
jgi:hypothetical protein